MELLGSFTDNVEPQGYNSRRAGTRQQMIMAHALARTVILYMAFHCTPAFPCESFEALRRNYIGDLCASTNSSSLIILTLSL